MIGYYIHHSGRGHLSRASVVASRSRVPVTGISSLERPADWPGEWVSLPRDDGGDPIAPTRGGAWHWVPRDHEGFRARMRVIADWISHRRPAAIVSDVSVEVLALAALLGQRTAYVLLHGRRDDPPHHLALATADLLLAPWPGGHRQGWHEDLEAPLVATGAFGRYDDRAPLPLPTDPRVLVVAGAGPHRFTQDAIAAAAEATPGWFWEAVGLGATGPPGVAWHGWRDDLWELLGSAAVVVATAGNGVVAEIAAARRPALLIPQERPFDEQRDLADCVARLSPARVAPVWPEPLAWPAILRDLARLRGASWSRHVDGRGADRFVAAIEELAA